MSRVSAITGNWVTPDVALKRTLKLAVWLRSMASEIRWCGSKTTGKLAPASTLKP